MFVLYLWLCHQMCFQWDSPRIELTKWNKKYNHHFVCSDDLQLTFFVNFVDPSDIFFLRYSHRVGVGFYGLFYFWRLGTSTGKIINVQIIFTWLKNGMHNRKYKCSQICTSLTWCKDGHFGKTTLDLLERP